MSAWTVILLVFGGALAVEGVGWALAPDGMRQAYEDAMKMLDGPSLSRMGLICAALGCLMIFVGIRLHG